MADDLQITPQGDEPANGGSNASPGDYKFDPAEAGLEENGKINLSGGETPAPIPGLIGASTEKEGEIIAPMKLESEKPATEEPAAEEVATEEVAAEEVAAEEVAAEEPATEKPATEEPAAEEVATEESATEESSAEQAAMEESATEEAALESAATAETTPKKKGLSKIILFLGSLLLAMLIGAGAYYGLGGLFKGELTDEQLRQAAAEGLCPTDTYYDAATMSTSSLEIRETDLSTTRTSLERNYAARDFGRAQLMRDAIQPISQPTITTTTLAPSKSTDMLDTTTTITTTTTTSGNDPNTLNAVDVENINLARNKESTLDTTYSSEMTTTAPSTDYTLKEVTEQPSISSESTTIPVPDEYEMGTNSSYTIDGGSMLDNDTSYTYEDSNESLIIDSSIMEGLDGLDGGVIVKPDTSTTSSFDPSMCKPIPQTDCTLLEKLRAEPAQYYISETTIMHMDGWIKACTATPIQTVCGKNQTLQRDGTCACSEGYFDISSASSTDILMTDFIGTTTTLQCVNCDQLNLIITKKSKELSTLIVGADTTVLEKELEALKAIAAENCVQEETPIEVKDCPENQVRDVTGACICAAGYEMNVDGICTLLQKPVSTVCGDNQITQRDGTCACVDGFFDISPVYQISTDAVRITDFVDTTSKLVCIDCAGIKELIQRNEEAIATSLKDTTELKRQTEALKLIAVEQCPAEEVVPERDIFPDREIITVVEESACEQFANNAEALLARGDVRGSYDAVIEYIKNDCGRTYNDCEEYLAIAKTAKEYSSIASTLSPASVSYFDDQYNRNRRAFYSNPACVNTADLCVEVKSEEPVNDRILTDNTEEPSVELLTGDNITSDMLMIDSTSEEPLTLEKLQRDVDYYISVRGIEDEKEKVDYITLYCPEEEVVITREEPTPVREEPAPVREEPAPVRLVPITVPEEPVTSPPSSGSSDSQPTAVLAASDEQPVAGGSVSKPIAGGTVSPATTAPPTETAAVTSDTYVASTTTTTTTTSSTETVSPATTTPDLRPAATVATPTTPAEPTLTPVDPSKPAPLITEETAPPDIYPVGPEVIMYGKYPEFKTACVQ